MMRWIKYLLFAFIVFLVSSKSFAHPPTDLTLEYDSTKKSLHISMAHVTHHMRRHHIRKIEVYKNKEDPVVLELLGSVSQQYGRVRFVPVFWYAADRVRLYAAEGLEHWIGGIDCYQPDGRQVRVPLRGLDGRSSGWYGRAVSISVRMRGSEELLEYNDVDLR